MDKLLKSDPSADFWIGWIEAFTIFQKYHPAVDINAEHDIIYAGPPPSKVSEEDKARLAQLRWHVDTMVDSFYHHV